MIVRNVFAVVAAAALLGASSRARAEHDFYYGHELIGADIGGWVLVAAGLKADANPVAIVGLATVVLGPPVIHAAHGDFGSAGADVGFRVGLPLLGGVLGNALCGDEERHKFLGCLGEVAIGALVGYLGAVAIDLAALGYHDKTPLDTNPIATHVLSFGVRF